MRAARWPGANAPRHTAHRRPRTLVRARPQQVQHALPATRVLVVVVAAARLAPAPLHLLPVERASPVPTLRPLALLPLLALSAVHAPHKHIVRNIHELRPSRPPACASLRQGSPVRTQREVTHM